MTPIRDFFTRIFKKKNDDKPWLEYYSREERSIKFTDKSIYDFLVESVGEDRDYPAINYFGNVLSFNEFFSNIDLCARSLREFGVREGDVVTICCPNMPEALYVFYACNKIGAIADMVHPLSSDAQLLSYLNNSESRLLILVDFNYEKFYDVIPKTKVYKTILVSPKESMPLGLTIGYTLTRGITLKKPAQGDSRYLSWRDFMIRGYKNHENYHAKMKKNDPAIILHSGGTTGTPKGIVISNYNFNAEAQQGGVAVIDVKPKDKVIALMPIFHGFGLGVGVHTPFCLRAEVILMPEYDAGRFYKIWKNEKPHVILGVPTLWEAMMSNRRMDNVDMSQLKYIISGGDYLTTAQENRLNDYIHRHGAHVNVAKGYGMTESVAATCFSISGANEVGSIGIPMVGNTYKICDPETHEELPIGSEGEICVHGPTVMLGYLNNKKETAKVLIRHKDGKIYLHTGDAGYISPTGSVFFTYRIKRMIVVSGFNVYPSEIEGVISKHNLVDRVCVIGVPHPYKMHVPKAFIVLKDGIEATPKIKKEIVELCKENLSVYAKPKYFEFRAELPKTLYGKINYKELEKEELEKATAKENK